MRFKISGITHTGSLREVNQDRILVQDQILSDGGIVLPKVETCRCFVADGIGGGPAGEYAAQFVLEQISEKLSMEKQYSNDELLALLSNINHQLIESSTNNFEIHGSGTTLIGMLFYQNSFEVIGAGDSPAYLFRDNTMIKINEDQVLDPTDENSPITSYFGGKTDALRLNIKTVLREIIPLDILVLASDGLFKATTVRRLKAILSNSKPIEEKNQFILTEALKAGAEDNISCILINVSE